MAEHTVPPSQLLAPSPPWALRASLILELEGWEEGCAGFCCLFHSFLSPGPHWARFKDGAEREELVLGGHRCGGSVGTSVGCPSLPPQPSEDPKTLDWASAELCLANANGGW